MISEAKDAAVKAKDVLDDLQTEQQIAKFIEARLRGDVQEALEDLHDFTDESGDCTSNWVLQVTLVLASP